MGITKKMSALMLIVVIILSMVSSYEVKADQFGTPKIKVKYINNKTGVKITISKAAGADAYKIMLKGYGSSYENYWSDYAKKEWWRTTGFILNVGGKKRTYTISCLPKGTYQVKVVAYLKDKNNYKEINESTVKTIKIKAAKVKTASEKTYDFSKTKVGDTITFGSYEQDGIMINGPEDIEWIVLSKSKTQMLVVSKYALDCLPYNTEWKDTSWEKCTLRKWLNKIFYKTAFTIAERKMIKNTKIKNSGNPLSGASGGKDTNDRIFLLSLSDIANTEYGFNSDLDNNDIKRSCVPTTYAIEANGAYVSDNYKMEEGDYFCTWWLRSPGLDAGYAAFVRISGRVSNDGSYVSIENIAVRPALYINLES